MLAFLTTDHENKEIWVDTAVENRTETKIPF